MGEIVHKKRNSETSQKLRRTSLTLNLTTLNRSQSSYKRLQKYSKVENLKKNGNQNESIRTSEQLTPTLIVLKVAINGLYKGTPRLKFKKRETKYAKIVLKNELQANKDRILIHPH